MLPIRQRNYDKAHILHTGASSSAGNPNLAEDGMEGFLGLYQEMSAGLRHLFVYVFVLCSANFSWNSSHSSRGTKSFGTFCKIL